MSHFRSIVGNNTVKQQLERLLATGDLPHLLLFTGVEGIGKRLFARAFARAWLQCEAKSLQPDIHLLSPEGKTGMHSIASINRLLEEVNLAPFEAIGKAFIIDDAERMLPASANALLKTLEEPPANTLIILITSQPDQLLATTVSRAFQVRFCPVTAQEIATYLAGKGMSVDEASELALQANGSIGRLERHLLGQANPLDEELFAFFTGDEKGFYEISQLCSALQKRIDAKKKEKEAALKEEYASIMKEVSSSARQLIEQEIEGALALVHLYEYEMHLDAILTFYRDLVAISCNAKPTLEHRREALIGAYNQGKMLPLEQVEKQLRLAKTLLERSTPFQNVLESLLLSLVGH